MHCATFEGGFLFKGHTGTALLHNSSPGGLRCKTSSPIGEEVVGVVVEIKAKLVDVVGVVEGVVVGVVGTVVVDHWVKTTYALTPTTTTMINTIARLAMSRFYHLLP